MTAMQMNDLVDIDSQWQGVEEPEGFTPIPDGRYNAIIEVARPEYTKQNQRCLYWELVIIGGPQDGKKIFRRNMLETPQNIGWLKADLRKCSIDVDSPSFTPSGFLTQGTASLIGLVMDITLKTGKPNDQGQTYQNCNFNGIAGEDDGQGVVAPPKPTQPASVPRARSGAAPTTTTPGRLPGTAPVAAGTPNPWRKQA